MIVKISKNLRSYSGQSKVLVVNTDNIVTLENFITINQPDSMLGDTVLLSFYLVINGVKYLTYSQYVSAKSLKAEGSESYLQEAYCQYDTLVQSIENKAHIDVPADTP